MSEWQDEGTLRELHHSEELTQKEIADRLGCTPQTVRRWLRRHNIEIRSHTDVLAGDDHPNFKSNEPRTYPSNWLQLSEKVRERDDYECQRCGMSRQEHREILGRDLEVHHIRPIHGVGDDADMDNLITLCLHCHRDIEDLPPDEQWDVVS